MLLVLVHKIQEKKWSVELFPSVKTYWHFSNTMETYDNYFKFTFFLLFW